MAEELADLRNRIENEVEGYWNDDEAQQFRNELDDLLDDNVSDAFEECTEQTGQSLVDCLEEKAEEEGVSTEFESAWENAPDDLVSSLRTINSLWKNDQRDLVRQVALDADLGKLNRLCAEGEYQEVSDELGIETPTTYQECVTATADAGDVRGSLQELWGTA